MIVTRRFIVASIGLLLSLGAIATTQTSLSNAISNALPTTQSPPSLPPPLATEILSDLRQRLGLPEMTPLKIIRVVRQTDLNPSVATSTLQVTVQAQGQTWVYHADPSKGVNFVPVESIPPRVKARVAKRLGIPAANLRIKAAQLVTRMRDCPPNADCMVGYAWGWRILTSNVSTSLFSVDAEGNSWPNEWQERTSTAGLPLHLKAAVMQDVINRLDGIPQNFMVLGIKPLTWNFCGGVTSGDRPTDAPLMGICQNIKYEGWQMRVQSGGVRYVYYVQKSDRELSITPDGRQSIPQSALLRVKQEAATRGNVSANEIAIQSVWAQYFDRCLDMASSEPSTPDCRNEIRAGWVVMVGAIHNAPGQPTAWVYHVSLLGDQAKFVRATDWSAPPIAPPPRR
jgi:hypothetical protein